MPYQTPPHHHHHRHHHHHHCFPLPHGRHHLFTNFSPSPARCPCLLHHRHHHFNGSSSHLQFLPIAPHGISSLPPNPCPVPEGCFRGCSTVLKAAEASVSDSCFQQQGQSMDLKLEDPGEEEELEDVFVLTDEWREFFAKSEAKRSMDKRQKNKHRK